MAVGETITQSEPTPICLEELTRNDILARKLIKDFISGKKEEKYQKQN